MPHSRSALARRRVGKMARSDGSTVAANHEEHVQWIRSLRESYSMRNSVRESVEHSISSSRSAAEEQQLPGDHELEFSELEEPVYRGLGALLSGYSSEGSQDFEVGHEPTYKSLGLDDGELDLEALAPEPEPMDAEWLATMPPLVHRQTGRFFL